MSGPDARNTSRWLLFTIAVIGGCGSTKQEGIVGTNREAIRATTDFGDAIATATIDETTHTIIATLEDPDQTDTLMTLEWNIDDGSAVWYAPDSDETNDIPEKDVRLAQTPTLEQANQMVYEQWMQGDDAYDGYCAQWTMVCSGITRCYQTVHCEEQCTVTPDSSSCEQVCNPQIECDWDWWCYPECINWGLFA